MRAWISASVGVCPSERSTEPSSLAEMRPSPSRSNRLNASWNSSRSSSVNSFRRLPDMVEVLAILKTFSKQPLYVLLERAIESETSGRESRADEYTQLLRAKRRTSLVVSSLGRMARKEQKFLRLSLHGDNHSVSWSHPQGPAMRCGANSPVSLRCGACECLGILPRASNSMRYPLAHFTECSKPEPYEHLFGTLFCGNRIFSIVKFLS